MGRRRRPIRYSIPTRLRPLAGSRAFWLVLGVAIIGGIVLGDRRGWFGRAGGDMARYDGRRFHVVKVVDGDTLDVDAADGLENRPTTRIRLWGVDTPETKHGPVSHFGPEAAAYTKSLTFGLQVRLRLLASQTRGKYRRLLAYVFLPDGRMLNLLLIEKGFGYADPRFDHPEKAAFAAAMKRARRERRGLWDELDAPDVPAYLRGRLGRPQPNGKSVPTIQSSTP